MAILDCGPQGRTCSLATLRAIANSLVDACRGRSREQFQGRRLHARERQDAAIHEQRRPLCYGWLAESNASTRVQRAAVDGGSRLWLPARPFAHSQDLIAGATQPISASACENERDRTRLRSVSAEPIERWRIRFLCSAEAKDYWVVITFVYGQRI